MKPEPVKADESSDLEDLSIAQLEQLIARNGREIADLLKGAAEEEEAA